MKEERVGSPISSVDPAIKLFGTTIAVTGGSTDAENGEVISDSPTPRQKAPLPCSQVGSLFLFPSSSASLSTTYGFLLHGPLLFTEISCGIHIPSNVHTQKNDFFLHGRTRLEASEKHFLRPLLSRTSSLHVPNRPLHKISSLIVNTHASFFLQMFKQIKLFNNFFSNFLILRSTGCSYQMLMIQTPCHEV
jgi:hypothetical protein